MKNFFGTYWGLIKKSYFSWLRNDAYARSATIAYYALFSFPTLLVIIVNIAGRFYGEDAIQGRITIELGEFIGEDAAQYIEEIIANVTLESSNVFTIIIGLVALFIGATGVFFQLKRALNNIWNVAEKNETFFRMLKDRLISFGMIMVVGLLLLISLVISTVLTALGNRIEEWAPNLTAGMLLLLNFVVSFFFITTLIAAIFKLLPDVKLRWKLAFVGSSVTTFLFLLGEYALSIYFAQSSPGVLYGGASYVVIILIWVYYTCLIVFFGAEFTVQYALYKNERVEPTSVAEPAIYKELEKLRNRELQLEEEKRVLDTLRSNRNHHEAEQNENLQKKKKKGKD